MKEFLRPCPALAKLVIVSLFLAALVTGCDDHRLNKGKPRIMVSPESISFRTLNIGEEDTQVLTVSNIGTAPLKIETVAIEGDEVFELESWGGSSFADAVFPYGITQPGQPETSSVELAISFSSQQLGNYQADVVITSDDEDTSTLRVPLDGVCSVPDIEIEPQLADFAGVALDSSSSLTITIKNTGQSDLIVPADEMELASGESESPFLWMASDMQIAPSSQAIMQVLYAPKEVHLDPETHEPLPDEDTLLIYSNDPDENPAQLQLTGYVDDNFAPLVSLRIAETRKLDGTPLDDPCAIATSDTAKFEATAIDPEGDFLQPSNLTWLVENRPLGSKRKLVIPDDQYTASFKPDMYGDYTICVKASDPQGNESTFDAQAACECSEANSKPEGNFDCQCIHFTAFPREDIRVELTWENLGPDLDLHLVAPAGDYCSPTRECRFNPTEEDPDWDQFACVDSGSIRVCRTPNCDAVEAGCEEEQVCFDDDDDGPNPPACYWKRCSGSDCYWDSRNPDWGIPGDEYDDPMLAIDCTHSCRAENINLNRPEQGIYRIMVNYFEYAGNTTATIRVFFKGDLEPTAEFTSEMTADCDTWNVALIDWVDPENHPVTYLDDNHSELCCE